MTARFKFGARKAPLFRTVRLFAPSAVLCAALFSSCARQAARPPTESKPPSANSSGTGIASGTSSFVVEDCPEAKKMDAKAAEAAMRKLIEPCHAINAPPAEFLATLVPGGRIELASRGKDSAEGVVPMCVVKNRLTHSVVLKQRCTFNVKLEPAAAVAPAASSSALLPAPERGAVR